MSKMLDVSLLVLSFLGLMVLPALFLLDPMEIDPSEPEGEAAVASSRASRASGQCLPYETHSVASSHK